MTSAFLAAAFAASISLTVEGAGRGTPVRWGIPWPRGAVKEARFRLTDDEGREIPVGTRALARWDDGSVKWSLVEFVCDAGAESAAFTLSDEPGGECPRVRSGESWKDVRLSNGKVELRVRKDDPELLSELGFDFDGDGGVEPHEFVIRPRPHPGGRLTVVRADGMNMEKEYLITRASPLGHSVRVERSTDLSATVVARGWYDAHPRLLRPGEEAAPAKGRGRVEVNLAQDGVSAVEARTGKKRWERQGSFAACALSPDERTVALADALGVKVIDLASDVELFSFPQAGVRSLLFKGERELVWRTGEGSFILSGWDWPYETRVTLWAGSPQVRVEHRIIFSGNPDTDFIRAAELWLDVEPAPEATAGREEPPQGTFHLRAGDRPLTFAVPELGERSPQELRWGKGGVVLSLWPEHAGRLLDLRRYSKWISPEEPYGEKLRPPSRSAQGATLSGELWVCPRGPARPGLPFVKLPEGWYAASGAWGRLPARTETLRRSFALVKGLLGFACESKRRFGWSGLIDHGDIRLPPWGESWANGSPGVLDGLSTAFALTGEREAFEMFQAAVRHHIEWDSCRYADGRGEYWKSGAGSAGGAHARGRQHWSGSVELLASCEGAAAVDLYFLTGERPRLDFALERARYIVRAGRGNRAVLSYFVGGFAALVEACSADPALSAELEWLRPALGEAVDLAKYEAPNMYTEYMVLGGLARAGESGREKLREICEKRPPQGLSSSRALGVWRGEKAAKTARALASFLVPPAELGGSWEEMFAELSASGRMRFLLERAGLVWGQFPYALTLLDEGPLSARTLGTALSPPKFAPPVEGVTFFSALDSERRAELDGLRARGVNFTRRGAYIDGSDRLAIPVSPTCQQSGRWKLPARNLSPERGAIAFMLRPARDGADGDWGVVFFAPGAGRKRGALFGSFPGDLLIDKRADGRLSFSIMTARGKIETGPVEKPLRAGQTAIVYAGWDASEGVISLSCDEYGEKRAASWEPLPWGPDAYLGSAAGALTVEGDYRTLAFFDRPERFQLCFEPFPTGPGIMLSDQLENASWSARKGGAARGDFVDGRVGRGFDCRGDSSLVYPVRAPHDGSRGPWTCIDARRGAFEMWFRPRWEPGDRKRHVFFHCAGIELAAEPGGELVFYYPAKGRRAVLARARAEWKKDGWLHAAASWDARARRARLFLRGRELESRSDAGGVPLEVPNLALRSRPRPPGYKAPVLEVGGKDGGESLDAVVDCVKAWDLPGESFPSSDGLLFRADFDSRWALDADYAEGDRRGWGLAEPGVEGRRGFAARATGLGKICFYGHDFLQDDRKRFRWINVLPERGTVAFWVRPTEETFRGRRCLAYLRFGGWNGGAIRVELEKGALRVRTKDARPVSARVEWRAGEWHHLAAAWERKRGLLALFANGRELGRVEGERLPPVEPELEPRSWWALGGGEGDHECAEADFDELRVYARVLGAGEIRALSD